METTSNISVLASVLNEGLSGTNNRNVPKGTAAPRVKLVSNSQDSASDPFNLLGAKLRNNGTPLADSSRTDPERPRDIRGFLKVFKNGLFEHAPDLTIVQRHMQPRCKTGVLTSVNMDHLPNLEDRLKDAMAKADGMSNSELARACKVSPTAVGKWVTGGKMSADNLACAARALGVRDDWLRTGRFPRERQHAEEDRQMDRVVEILAQIGALLVPLQGAINELTKARGDTAEKRKGRS